MMKLIFLTAFFGFSTLSLFSQSNHPIEDCLNDIDVPRAFSPNGDGSNDSLKIYWPCLPEKFEIKIFDKWGEEIYASTDPNFRWDGVGEDGFNLPIGVYLFTIEYTYFSKVHMLSGDFVLMK